LIIFGLLIVPTTIGFFLGVIGGWTTDGIQTPLENLWDRVVGLLFYAELWALPYAGLSLIKNKVNTKVYIILGIAFMVLVYYLALASTEIFI